MPAGPARNARAENVGKPDDIIGQYAEGEKNTNGVEIINFLESNKMKTLNDRSPKPEAQWTWTRKCKDKRERPFWTTWVGAWK